MVKLRYFVGMTIPQAAERLRVLGLAHPYTQWEINGLVNLSIDQWTFDEVQTILEQTVEQSRHELGPKSPKTLTWMSDLAKIRFLQGNPQEALALLQDALALAEQLPDDAKTLYVMNRLADEFLHQGDRGEALALYRRIVDLQERVLDHEDPNALAKKNNLARRLRDLGQEEEAKLLLEQVRDLASRKLDQDQSEQVERQRSLAQMMLRRLLGSGQGNTPIGPQSVPLTIDAPFKANSPVADGRIEEMHVCVRPIQEPAIFINLECVDFFFVNSNERGESLERHSRSNEDESSTTCSFSIHASTIG